MEGKSRVFWLYKVYEHYLICNLDSLITDNLIHNRIRFKACLSDKITSVIEMRNRYFMDKLLDLNSFLASSLDNDKGIVDMSYVSLDENL